MSEIELKQLVERYFAAVDNKDLSIVLSFFSSNATFTIATYQSTFKGRNTEIADMFTRLFSRYDKIVHTNFDHFPSPPHMISSRFEVQNKRRGSPTACKYESISRLSLELGLLL